MKSEYYIVINPAAGRADVGPFPYQAWALGWAFMELKDYPLGWWTVKNKKTKSPKFKKIRNRADV